MAEKGSPIAQYEALLIQLGVAPEDAKRNAKKVALSDARELMVSMPADLGLRRIEQLHAIGHQPSKDRITLLALESLGQYGVAAYTICAEAVDTMNGILKPGRQFLTISDLVHPHIRNRISFVGSYELSDQIGMAGDTSLGNAISGALYDVTGRGAGHERVRERMNRTYDDFDRIINREHEGWRWFVAKALEPARYKVAKYFNCASK